MISQVALKHSHVYLDSNLVTAIFGETNFAYVVYKEDQKSLLITPVTSLWFKKMYKPTQFILKERNLKGDKTLSVREIFIDNDLDTNDRDLDYTIVEKTKLIKIKL